MPQENTAKNQKSVRDIDPNILQRRASNPESSVWVNASAGTGKTKVLTDRVLRLLLPTPHGAPGTKPHKILGITFTKAAASEMSLRITERLGSWAIMPEENLEKDLHNLLNKKPTDLDIRCARQLFADVIDSPGGLKIMTIHAFCQSVLGRFPLEAELPPYFSVLEEPQAQDLLEKAQQNIITRAQQQRGSELYESFTHIAHTINEDQFFDLLKDIISERRQFERIYKENFGTDGIYNALCTALNITPGQNLNDLRHNYCNDKNLNLGALKKAADALLTSDKKTDLKNGQIISAWLNAPKQGRAESIEGYISVYLTNNGTVRKTLATKSATKNFPDILDTMQEEAQRLEEYLEQEKSLLCATLTRDILHLGYEALKEYEALKNENAALDFDDLILKTRTLLTGDKNNFRNASWVLYKMDQGLDHILVDEAQDTNPDQWSIIEALCHEFFAGDGANENTRTVFVVGDEKQSIYSFQRASPEEFARMKHDFQAKILNAQKRWDPVDINISFRSTQSILRAVDAVFANADLRKGLSINDINHHAYRRADAGLVELWPVFEGDPNEEISLWDPPVHLTHNQAGKVKLAEHLGDTIKGWLDNKEQLTSKNRAIRPGDIMILVRSRSALVGAIARALKTRNIPISGSDRMILNDEIIVQDLLSATNFTLLPDDDLNLACLLKSPFIGMDEDTLFELCNKRTGSLWSSIQNSSHENISDYLFSLKKYARTLNPFDFFTAILQTPCPADQQSALRAIQTRLGGETLDAINEFLRTILDFERKNTPSLQNFVHWQSAKQDQIKRELEESGNQVRIMTVHGSKGLQAPIVIMPDTMRTTTSPPGQIDKRLIWPDKSKLTVPIWSPRKDHDPALFSAQMAGLDERLDEEYRRLLYVAMTRAEDRLYVAGYSEQKKPLDNSWYYFIKSGLKSLPNHSDENGILKISNPQTSEIKYKKEEKKPTSQILNLPRFLYEHAPAEEKPLMPFTPSRTTDEQDTATSPLQAQNNYRFRRGNITHKLLEILPDIAKEQRESVASSFTQKYARDLPQDIRANIVQETLTLLNNAAFSDIFSPDARAEVPISGRLDDGRIINGQIDRLLITEHEILIIDYKTNRPPPTDPTNIPPIYRQQMQAYADTMKKIYPGRAIKAALLWTDGPYLMPVEIK